jgi:hypothetical protein
VARPPEVASEAGRLCAIDRPALIFVQLLSFAQPYGSNGLLSFYLTISTDLAKQPRVTLVKICRVLLPKLTAQSRVARFFLAQLPKWEKCKK